MKINKFIKKLAIASLGLAFAYLFITTLFFGQTFIATAETKLNGLDGPYIVDQKIYYVNADNQLKSALLDTAAVIPVRVNNQDLDTFNVKIQNHQQHQPETYPMPERLIAISDIEGNFNGFYSFLIRNRVIDKNYNWTYGKGHLVLNGDFVDRGDNVTQVLWLIYHLDQQAAKAGGKVHYILGNHEIINMYGNASYADKKYLEVAKQISKESEGDKATQYLYGTQSIIGRWLRSKNIMEKIGSNIFVHAGLNKILIQEDLSLSRINEIAKKHYGSNPEIEGLDKQTYLILKSNHSPYWDRTLSLNIFYQIQYFTRKPFQPMPSRQNQEDVEEVLKHFQANRMVIGHSIVSDIKADYQGKVIKIDLKHGQTKFSGKTKGLLIENGLLYKVDDLGKKSPLE